MVVADPLSSLQRSHPEVTDAARSAAGSTAALRAGQHGQAWNREEWGSEHRRRAGVAAVAPQRLRLL